MFFSIVLTPFFPFPVYEVPTIHVNTSNRRIHLPVWKRELDKTSQDKTSHAIYCYPGQNIPQRFAIPDKTSHAVFVTPDITSQAISATPDKNIPCFFCHPRQSILFSGIFSGKNSLIRQIIQRYWSVVAISLWNTYELMMIYSMLAFEFLFVRGNHLKKGIDPDETTHFRGQS